MSGVVLSGNGGWLLAQELGGVPYWVYLLALVLIAALLVLPRKLARRSKILPNDNLSDTERLRKQMETLLIQLQEAAREINAGLDTKMIALNQLIEEADAKIAELERLRDLKTPAGPTGGEETVPTEREERFKEPTRTSQRPEVEAQVLQLASQGKSRLDIARQTGISVGEIDLMLALHKKASANGDASTGGAA